MNAPFTSGNSQNHFQRADCKKCVKFNFFLKFSLFTYKSRKKEKLYNVYLEDGPPNPCRTPIPLVTSEISTDTNENGSCHGSRKKERLIYHPPLIRLTLKSARHWNGCQSVSFTQCFVDLGDRTDKKETTILLHFGDVTLKLNYSHTPLTRNMFTYTSLPK